MDPRVVELAEIRLGLPKLGAALKGVGSTQSPPPTLETRLTPVAPKLSSGAQITRASTVLFNGSDNDLPDGAFVLVRGTGMPISSVEMRVPTEAGKFYVYDCRMQLVGGTKLTLSRAGATSLATVEDGHVIGAFAATTTSTNVAVVVAPSAGETNAVLAHFYGCDVGKAN